MGDSLLGQGLSLMLYGMGLVFFFLALLVVVTGAMSAVVGKYFPEDMGQPDDHPPQPSGSRIEPRVVKIIEAAIAQHRSKTRK